MSSLKSPTKGRGISSYVSTYGLRVAECYDLPAYGRSKF